MLIGYARVSTTDQDLALQQDALAQAGCERVYIDKASGTKTDRPGLAEALAFARPGDVLVVWKLDRLGRSLQHLMQTVEQLAEQGIGFRSLTEQLDTTTPGGRLIFHLFAALAQFERDLIRERTQAGLTAARARGRNGGGQRHKAMREERQRQLAQRMYEDRDNPIPDICKALGISRATLYRYVSVGKRVAAG
jgi:DNA invertase Pin-like site-specific DNA recombinase